MSTLRITQTITVSPDLLDLEDLVLQVAYLGLLADRVGQNGHAVPESLRDARKAAERELQHRLRDDQEKQLRTLKLRREGLLTADEKRQKLDAEIAALEQKLTVPA